MIIASVQKFSINKKKSHFLTEMVARKDEFSTPFLEHAELNNTIRLWSYKLFFMYIYVTSLMCVKNKKQTQTEKVLQNTSNTQAN